MMKKCRKKYFFITYKKVPKTHKLSTLMQVVVEMTIDYIYNSEMWDVINYGK